MLTKFQKVSLFLCFLFLVSAVPADAQGLLPCGPGPGAEQVSGNVSGCTIKDIFKLLVGVYNFLLGMAAVVAMLFLVWGGVQMLLFGALIYGDEEWVKRGRSTVWNAVLGIIIVLTAYLVVNTLLVVLGVTEKDQYFLGTFL